MGGARPHRPGHALLLRRVPLTANPAHHPERTRLKPTDVRTILITGAAHGLGREVARQLAQAGHRIIITAREADAAVAAADELGPQVDALAVDLDVADAVSVTHAAAALTSTPGKLDTLINNAAAYVDWSEMGSTADLVAAHQVLETNLFSAWRVTQALLPLLRQSSAPRIVNISSGAGSHDDPPSGCADAAEPSRPTASVRPH